MSSLLGSRFPFFASPGTRSSVVIRRLQQTFAAVNSSNENTQIGSDVVPVFKHASRFADKTALRDAHGDYTYRGLYLSSRQFANQITQAVSASRQERVAFLMPNDANYVITQWACWMSGQIAVPLSSAHPASILEYYITDSDAKVLVTTPQFLPLVEPIAKSSNRQLIVLDDTLRMLALKFDGKKANNRGHFEYEIGDLPEAGMDGDFYNNSNALFVYTSGTTGKPKGVVLSHKNIQSQVSSLVDAWKWTEKDIILHTLPLYHIHGIVNVLLCPLHVGARCVMLPKFDASSVWTQLLAVNVQNTERVNVFMAVPTIYAKLIQEYEQRFNKNDKMKEYIHTVCSTKIRLMVSGSAPLPRPIFERWEEITGHRLLERYGMSEIGMALSNPVDGPRIPGTVGTPLPGIEVRITKSDAAGPETEVLLQGSSKGLDKINSLHKKIDGHLEVRGSGIFRQYWKKPEATKEAFTSDGWFKTGDIAQYENGVYKILGRSSVDIIKTGGYKVSALNVETEILSHPDIQDCAVIGLPDDTWGQKVAAIIVLHPGKELILSELREFTKKLLPEYAVPTVLKVVDAIPKNAMGKVNKVDLLKTVFPGNKI
ncbi:malonate--CoA ligase ACSF3, mitochondrial [Neodiprion lecontei]|uniref:Acyl-CoA synthetase family member 3, mitochondrial n=1 Tax=Neodiprion lecontei TaxID=441921 RepID=A0A6J0CC55_NEOLC|nr:malonate--CoA ligase ACSF3, mitochondrial [Neodiprion lecontei]XP_015524264.1 malonate--CoA ligase ACSF3, mitochondrial [Neodiprion lecontei]XP_046589930.1 malonate--CoA ligase ACSF3, mitochondrial [Neodiprion lecontei]